MSEQFKTGPLLVLKGITRPVIRRWSECRPMPASSSITARAVANGLSRSSAIAACSVPTDRCRVHRSNKINRVVLETASLVISDDRRDVGCWQILLQKWVALTSTQLSYPTAAPLCIIRSRINDSLPAQPCTVRLNTILRTA